MLRKIIVVSFFMLAFMAFNPGNASAQANATFATLEECQEAYDNGTYRIYQSRFRGNAYKVANLPKSTLPTDSCVKQDVVNGTGPNARWTVQDTSILFIFSGKTVTHRADCGNKVYDVVALGKKTVAVREKVIDCDKGYTWDADRNKCVMKGESKIICDDGYTWNPEHKQCEVKGDNQVICDDGYKLNDRTGRCEIRAENANCPKDYLWDINAGQCVKKSSSNKWKWIAGAAAVVTTVAVVYAVKKKGKDCPTTPTVVPTKTLPTTGSQVPIRTGVSGGNQGGIIAGDGVPAVPINPIPDRPTLSNPTGGAINTTGGGSRPGFGFAKNGNSSSSNSTRTSSGSAAPRGVTETPATSGTTQSKKMVRIM